MLHSLLFFISTAISRCRFDISEQTISTPPYKSSKGHATTRYI